MIAEMSEEPLAHAKHPLTNAITSSRSISSDLKDRLSLSSQSLFLLLPPSQLMMAALVANLPLSTYDTLILNSRRSRRRQTGWRRRMLQDSKDAPDAHDHYLVRCASPDYQRHRYYTPDYEARRSRANALKELMGIGTAHTIQRPPLWDADCLPFELQSSEDLSCVSTQTKEDEPHTLKRKRAFNTSDGDSDNEDWISKKIKYHQASQSVGSAPFKPTYRQLRLAKRAAPRRMRTRSMSKMEPVTLANRKGCVKIWYARREKEVELPYEDYERFFVSASSIP